MARGIRRPLLSQEGFLVPRTQSGAVIDNDEKALKQVLDMANNGVVRSIDGKEIAIQADTLCIHGDNPHAVDFAKKIKVALH
jgi:UPF0271 protein